MTPRYTELQLDALRELANIASGNAATALSQMLGREIDLSVPRVLALPLVDAIDACGQPRRVHHRASSSPLEGDIEGIVLLLIPHRRRGRPVPAARRRCRQRDRRLGAARDRQHPRRRLPERAVVDDRARISARARRSLTTDMLGAIVSVARAVARPRAPTWCSCSTPSSTSPTSRARSRSCCCRPPAASPTCSPRSASRRRDRDGHRCAWERSRCPSVPVTSSSPAAWGPASVWRWSTASPGSRASPISCCPKPTDSDREPGKFADLAVPELIDRVCRAGASRRRLEAVLAGGARMFDARASSTSAPATRRRFAPALAASGVSVRAAETGGNRGRTLRVEVGDCTVTVKEAGGAPHHSARRFSRRRPPPAVRPRPDRSRRDERDA